MAWGTATLVHMGIGSVALSLWWVAFSARKGSRRHRAAGKFFFLTLMGVTASVGALFAVGRILSPPLVVQFLYLSLCLVGITWVGWRAIRLKDDADRFRSNGLRYLAWMLLLGGLAVLAAGVASARPLTMLFSVIGLAYGAGLLAFLGWKGPLTPRWWLGWHLNAVCGLFNAVHGTLLAVIWKQAFDQQGDGANIAFQLLTMVAAVGLRDAMGRKYSLPWGFGPVAQPRGWALW